MDQLRVIATDTELFHDLFPNGVSVTAKLPAYSDYFKTHDETSQPIKVFIIHYNVIAHKIKTEI
jgi:hypothetical protein